MNVFTLDPAGKCEIIIGALAMLFTVLFISAIFFSRSEHVFGLVWQAFPKLSKVESSNKKIDRTPKALLV